MFHGGVCFVVFEHAPSKPHGAYLPGKRSPQASLARGVCSLGFERCMLKPQGTYHPMEHRGRLLKIMPNKRFFFDGRSGQASGYLINSFSRLVIMPAICNLTFGSHFSTVCSCTAHTRDTRVSIPVVAVREDVVNAGSRSDSHQL